MAVGGCGNADESDGEKLPTATADQLSAQLVSISERVASRNAGACGDIFEPDPVGNIEAIDTTMAGIPGRVDRDIRTALEQSIDRLKQLIDTECEGIVAEDERERRQEEEAVPEEPTTPEPTIEEPVTTEPPTTTEPEAEPKPEKEKDEEEPPGQGPDGEGPPGQGGGGVEAPTDEGGQ